MTVENALHLDADSYHDAVIIRLPASPTEGCSSRAPEDDGSILPREVGRKKRSTARFARFCAGRLSLRG